MNYYEILGVSRNASRAELKKKYKELVKKYHPDVYKGDLTFAQKRTAEINVAYDVLSVPEKREEYDRKIFPSTTYSYTPPQYKYDSSYTPPKYNTSYSTSQKSSYSSQSYDEYKHKYTRSYYTNNTNDGSEHDYSTYVNYGGIPHRPQSKTSNYSKNFEDNVITDFDNLKKRNKIVIIFFIVIFYIIILILSMFQLINTFKKDPSSSELSYITSDSSSTESSFISDDFIFQFFNPENNKTPTESDTRIPEYRSPEIDLNDYFSETELRNLYSKLKLELGYEITYEEFLSLIYKYIDAFLLQK